MENTETNYTTNKTLMDYYKANIDVHIDYLLFLNSFKGISKEKGFMELAPIIESLREKLYQAFEYDLIPDATNQVNMMITRKLESILDEMNLSEIKEYIGDGLTEEYIINLSTSIFLRRSIGAIPAFSNKDSIEEKTITSTLSKMSNSIPSSDPSINGYSFELASYFLSSLRIDAKENTSLISYIYDYICSANMINLMARRLDKDIRISSETDFLIKELFQSLYITSNYSLANLIDELTANIESLNKKQNKYLAIEKHS